MYFLFVSLLGHFWLIHSFYLHLLYQPYVGLCQAMCVQSQQRQPTSAVAIATCEVQVLAADSHTVPTVATGVSKPLCCRLILTFTLTSENLSLYITLLLLLVVIQLCSPRCWHLDSNYCRTIIYTNIQIYKRSSTKLFIKVQNKVWVCPETRAKQKIKHVLRADALVSKFVSTNIKCLWKGEEI